MPRRPPQAPPALKKHLDVVHGSYYPSWHIYRGVKPSSMNLALTSHVFYAFARVQPDGNIFHLDEKADTQLPVDSSVGCIQACIQAKKQFPDLKVLISIGGGSGSEPFAALASSTETRENFGKSSREFVDRFGFDGVDVDWEHPSTSEQGRDYLLLLQTLRRYLPTHQLTTALPAGEWCLRNIDMAETARTLDFINLMCYDFAGPWTGKSGHQAQLFASQTPHNAFAMRSGDGAVKYLISMGVSPDKIVMGIPVYGRSFLGAQDVGQDFHGHGGDGGTFDFKDLPRGESTETINTQLVAASCYGGDGGWVSYDTPDTVRLKAEYVKQVGLRGLFYWTGTTDAPPGPRSLLTTGYEALNDSKRSPYSNAKARDVRIEHIRSGQVKFLGTKDLESLH